MNFSIVTILIIASVATCVQSMNVREKYVRKYLQKQVMQQYVQQKLEQQSMEKNIPMKIPLKKALVKAALSKFSNCHKLKIKLMIRYRNRPRLLRRISKLTLDC